ncbi:MAG: CotH kinase family protein, partial [Fibrobacter sp.]|nr:CotH kinase family protein [Fibrobacter sp.]
YKFCGWYDNAAFDGTPLVGWSVGEKNAPVTLYAKWEIMKDDIVFLESFSFSQNHNSDLPNDLCEAQVITPKMDSIEYTTLSWIENIRFLIPSFSAEGIVYSNGIEIQSGVTPLDFSEPVQLVVVKETGSKEYKITLNCPQTTGLPIVRISTKNAVPINSKETYVYANIQMIDGSNPDNNYITTEFSEEYADKIRGRGHATWEYEKKPYKIKLNKKMNLLNIGNDKGKDWVLLANYCDKTLLRTAVGFWVNEKMELSWTPNSRFVDLFVNEEYLGTYQLCESVSVSEGRINIPKKTGYLIEHSRFYELEPKYFVTSQYEFGYFFKHPDSDDLTDVQRENIINFMNSFETSLAGDGFVDSEKNSYKKYIDSESFAKWFITHNILANMDMNYYYYINSLEIGKLKMGPAWDFEWSIGIGWYEGNRPPPADYWCAKNKYTVRLLQDPEFVSLLQTVWNSYKATIQNGIYDYMNQTASEIKNSRILNFKRWNIMNSRVSVGGNPLGSYEAELACDIQFLQNRFLWLDAEIQALSKN